MIEIISSDSIALIFPETPSTTTTNELIQENLTTIDNSDLRSIPMTYYNNA